jgi:hypothetical protein
MSEDFLQSIPNPGLWADVLLVAHASIVCFVIGGLVAILLGWWREWAWVRNIWFRLIHLATIAVVVTQAWLGRLCPLTIWEQQLRRAAGQAVFEKSFIEHWIGELLYWNLPWWVFVAAYTAFGTIVVWTWLKLPPR